MLKIDCYPDADFAGLYGYEKCNDPTRVKSQSRYVITLNTAPVAAKSSLQNIVACSTMEAEILALHASCIELFPIMDMVPFLEFVVGLAVDPTNMSVLNHEDSARGLVLADMTPPQFTPRSKTYHVKTIWFREEVKKQDIQILKINTVEQLGDMFTKGLPAKTFRYLPKKVTGGLSFQFSLFVFCYLVSMWRY